LNEFVYDAAVAGLGVSLDFTPKAARLSFSGYSDKLPAFVDTMSKAIAAHPLQILTKSLGLRIRLVGN